jgi:glycerol kinase
LESTARGVAWMAGLTIGIYQDLEAISNLKMATVTYHAKMAEALRETLLQGWKEAVKATIQYKRPSFDDLTL